MKKHHLNISTISVLCVLCAGLTTNAMAAASVRSLGGSGTFDGTSAASTSTRAVAPARAGSLRVSPAGTRLITTTNSGKTSSGATAGTTQRLSIGKYLRDNEATSGGVSGGTSGGSDPAASSARVGELEERIDVLENDIIGDPNAQAPASNTLAGRVAAIEDQIDLIEVGGVQGSQDGVVEVSGTGEVSINVDKLVEKLEDQGAISSSRETEIRYTSGNDLQWRYTSGSAQDQEWKTLLNASALTGDYATSDQLSQAVSNVATTYATKAELSGYAKTTDLSGYAKTTDLPTKTSDLTNDSGFLTAHQDVSGKADKATTLSGYGITDAYTKSEVDDKVANVVAGDMSEALSGYAKTTDLPTKTSDLTNDSGFLTAHQSLEGYAKTADLPVVPTAVSAFTNDAGYLTDANLSDYAKTTDLSGYAKTTDLPTKTSDLTNDSGFLTAHQSLEGYAKTTDLPVVPTAVSAFTNDAGYLTAHQDVSGKADKATTLSGYGITDAYTKSEVDDKVANVVAGDMSEALSGYAKTTDLPTKTSDLTNDSGFLTAHQSLEGYAKTTDLPVVPTAVSAFTNDAGYLTDANLSDYAKTTDLSGYAKTTDLPTKTSDLTNDSGFLTAHQSLEGYAKTTDLPTKTSDLTNDSGFLTAHQDVSGKADKATTLSGYGITDAYTKSEVDDKVANVVAGDMSEALSGYAKTTDLPTKTSDLTNDSGFLTEHQSLAGLATTAQLATKADASDLDNYATTASLSDYLTTTDAAAAYQVKGDYATTTALNAKADASALDNYLTTANAATTYQPKGDYATTAQLATKADASTLNDYATIIALNAKQDAIANLATIEAGAAAGATALQPSEVTTGGANGTIAVDGTDVPVKGLGNVAYANATLPSTNGDYMLMVNRNNGTYSYTWQDASTYTGGGNSGGGNDDPVLDDEGLW